MRWLLPLALTLAAAATAADWSRRRMESSADSDFTDEPEAEQGAPSSPLTWLDDVVTTIDPRTYMTPAVPQNVAEANLAACLFMLRYAEGTAGDDGYRTLFGGALFDDYSDHPRRAVQFRNGNGELLWTTAAGAYQFMAVSRLPSGKFTKMDTWDRLQRKLNLPDFSPASQDAAAVELIRERGALGDAMAGNVGAFVRKCAPIWASLPGAGYAQPERKLSSLQAAFQSAGGMTA